MSNCILVTGGLGYIGSHTVVRLLELGFPVVVLDNYAQAYPECLAGIQKITGKNPVVIKGDIKDKSKLAEIFKENKIEAVIHFAALKNVIDSQSQPMEYYENNVIGTFNLLEVMNQYATKNLIFSSSCSVYGNTTQVPINEETPVQPLSVYARTKLINEYLIADAASIGINSVSLRYYNAAGAHPSGNLGENPKNVNSLISRIFGTLLHNYQLNIYGDSFNTADGFQVRDFIHVQDLAEAHIASLGYLENHNGNTIFNIGTGAGTSVKKVIDTVEKISEKVIPYTIKPANASEVITSYCDNSKALELLGWNPKYSIVDIIKDDWNWYRQFIK